MQILDESTLMIILTEEDLKRKSIDLDRMSDDDFQSILEKLLILAKIDLGFETRDSFLEIEVVECSDGIVITVIKESTRPRKLKSERSNEKLNFNRQVPKSKSLNKSVASKQDEYTTITFEFQNPDSLMNSIKQLKGVESRKKIPINQSDIYLMNKKYYLVINIPERSKKLYNSLLLEYGRKVNNLVKYKLIEYGNMLYGKTAINDIGKIS